MKDLASIQLWIDGHRAVFFDLVRIYLGIGLFVKAIFFLMNRDHLASLVGELGGLWIIPFFVTHYVMLAHLMGGLALALGLLTRWAAIAQIPILLGAVFYVHLPHAVSIDLRQSLEFSALVLFLLVMIALRGPGPLSLDAYLERKTREETLLGPGPHPREA